MASEKTDMGGQPVVEEDKLQFNGLRPKFGIRNAEFGIARGTNGLAVISPPRLSKNPLTSTIFAEMENAGLPPRSIIPNSEFRISCRASLGDKLQFTVPQSASHPSKRNAP
jgi:hypothetical protein